MTTFHRPPRVREVVQPVEVELPTPPAEPRSSQIAPLGRVLLITLLPSLMPPVALGLATWALGLSSTVIITSMALAGSLGLAVVITTLMSRRDEQARVRAEQDEYHAKLAQYQASLRTLDSQCSNLIERERRILGHQFPGQECLGQLVLRDRSRLWERRPGDDDFLHIRLGSWSRPSCIRFKKGASDEDPLSRDLVNRHQTIPGAALTIELPAGASKGLFGTDAGLDAALGNLAHQLAIQHAPSEVRVAVFSRNEELCDWAKWLPHARIESRREVTSLVGRTGAEASLALRAVAADVGTPGPVGTVATSYVVIADCRNWESLPGRLARWLGPVRDRVAVVVANHAFEDLPSDCDEVVDLSNTIARLLRKAETGTPPEFVSDGFTPQAARESAHAITALREGAGAIRTPIPRSARLADIVDLEAVTPTQIASSWSKSRSAFRLAAPIGVGPDEEVVSIDLRQDGPHGLIAGTTGSGKSELLQSLVASFSMRIPPDLLNFLLVDYKGGSAFKEIADLPQVVGVVTDLDERLANRALESLRAELRRREHLLAKASPSAANIIEYQAHRREVPLANLVIIIDEFHRLVTEQPEFIEQMVRIAQQGRSLGVHLILSTQKPSGVVTDQIRANTNLRISLRVTDDADSRDVLGSSEAAEIPRELPGRMYIRVGTDPLRVCQAGRISGKVPRGGDEEAILARPFLDPVRGPIARRNGIAARELPDAAPEAADDSQDAELVDERVLLVAAVLEASRLARIPAQPPPWKEPLPSRLLLDELEDDDDVEDASAIAGILDEPELQQQRPFVIDLSSGHVCVAGGPNTGKTTALLTFAEALGRRRGPDKLHIYGLDFAGGDLQRLTAMPHCGGVAAQHEWPSVQWVLQALKDIVAERLASQSDHPRAQILVLVDNLTAFWSALQDVESGQELADDLQHLMDIGRAVGVTFAVTAERPDAIRSNVFGLMTTRLALPMPDTEGYAAFGLSRVAKQGEPIQGRAWLAGRTPHEVQLALPVRLAGDDPWPGEAGKGGPLPISPLPPAIDYQALLNVAGNPTSGLLLGLREGTHPLFVLPPDQHIIAIGPRGSGRSKTLAVAALEARRLGAEKIFIANPRRSDPLRKVAAELGEAALYGESPSGCEELLEQLAELTSERFAEYSTGDAPSGNWAVFIDDADIIDFSISAAETLEKLVLRGSDIGVTLYVSASSQALRARYPVGVIRALLNQRAGILLAPTTMEDFDLLGARGRPVKVGPGRGWWCEGGGKTAVQVSVT